MTCPIRSCLVSMVYSQQKPIAAPHWLMAPKGTSHFHGNTKHVELECYYCTGYCVQTRDFLYNNVLYMYHTVGNFHEFRDYLWKFSLWNLGAWPPLVAQASNPQSFLHEICIFHLRHNHTFLHLFFPQLITTTGSYKVGPFLPETPTSSLLAGHAARSAVRVHVGW